MVKKLSEKTIDINFMCYPYTDRSGHKYTIFLFYTDGMWGEDKSTLEEALTKYPPDKYNWICIDD